MSDEFGPSFITLTDEDGNDIELEYVDALEHEGQTYMAFFPAVEDEAEEESEDYGLVILKSVTENGEELLSTLDDEAELEKIYVHGTAAVRRGIKFLTISAKTPFIFPAGLL